MWHIINNFSSSLSFAMVLLLSPPSTSSPSPSTDMSWLHIPQYIQGTSSWHYFVNALCIMHCIALRNSLRIPLLITLHLNEPKNSFGPNIVLHLQFLDQHLFITKIVWDPPIFFWTRFFTWTSNSFEQFFYPNLIFYSIVF